jgi:tetratricopeptide (TPR) repeat protein
MSTLVEKRDRHIIPRWVPSVLRLNISEFSPGKPRQVKWDPDLGELKLRQQEWEENRGDAFAADLMGVALVLGEPNAASAAALSVLQDKKESSDELTGIARRILGMETGSIRDGTQRGSQARAEVGSRIHDMRTQLRDGPFNPLLWTDLALAWATLGEVDKAEKCLRIANNLAPHQRFILRAAARFYVHRDRPDVALNLLRRSPLVKTDPWVLSAEVAISDIVGKASPSIKIARSMLGDQKFSLGHLSELASALGTLEASAGARRRARKLLEQSLESPTENAVAQATWVGNEIGNFDLPEEVFDVDHAFEARALRCYYEQRWREAVECSLKWQGDEPFSMGPAMLGSHLASAVLEDYDLSARMARQGLVANPKDFGIANNLAFALACNGEVSEGARILDAIDSKALSDLHKIFYFATSGLIRFRLGEHEKGREFYRKAVDLASGTPLERERAKALLYFAREEIRIYSGAGPAVLIEAREAVEALDGAGLETLQLTLARLLKEANS